MQYTYPEIRDVFAICAEAVAQDPRTNRGYIRPGNDWKCKILHDILFIKGVKFEIRPGGVSTVSDANVQEIVFDLGQNKAIDTTVNEMSEDLDLFRRTANYIPEAERVRRGKRYGAIDKLENIITKIKRYVTSSDGGEYFYFYAPYDRLGDAESAFLDLGMVTFRHVSHLDGQEVTVLRYPATMIRGEQSDIIELLHLAIAMREMHREEALVELEDRLGKIKKVQYKTDTEPSHYYFFINPKYYTADDPVRCAMELMKLVGISGIEEYFSERFGQSVLRLPIKDVDEHAQEIINKLNGAINLRTKQDALMELKATIDDYFESDDEHNYVDLAFPSNFMTKAQELLHVLGISAELSSRNGIPVLRIKEIETHTGEIRRLPGLKFAAIQNQHAKRHMLHMAWEAENKKFWEALDGGRK